MDLNEMDKFAKSMVKEAGHKIRHSFFSTIEINTKSNLNDLVTNIDKEIEQFMIRKIQQQYPAHRILGEEGFGHVVESLQGVVWIVDPIDGTLNFVHQQRNFAISVGVYIDGVGMLGYIYDVVRDELYSAEKGKGAYVNDERLPMIEQQSIHKAVIGMNARWLAPNRFQLQTQLFRVVADCRSTRSYGSAALEIAYVASGKLNGYISFNLSPWDIAGGAVIAQEVGAIVTTVTGAPANYLTADTFILANEVLHDQLLNEYLLT